MNLSKLKLAGLGAVCALLAGCSGDSIEESVDYLPVQMKDGGNWSIIDPKGKVIVDDEFRNEPSVVCDGIFYVYEGSTYSIYNVSDVKKPKVEDLTDVGYFHDGIIPATPKGERIHLYDKKGKVKATLGADIRACMAYAQEGLLGVKNEDGLWGYVNTSGKVKIKPRYSEANYFSEGLALVKKDDEKLLVINKDGKELFTLKEDYRPIAKEFHDGLLPVRDTGKECFGFLNKKGEFTKVSGNLPDAEDHLITFNSDYYVFRNDDREEGVKTIKGETIIKAKYYGVFLLSDGNFLVGEETDSRVNCYVINKKGDKKIEFEDYRRGAIPFNDNFKFIGRTKSKYALLNKKGEQIGDDDYADINIALKKDSRVYSDYSEAIAEEATEECEAVCEEGYEQVATEEAVAVGNEYPDGTDIWEFTGSIGKYPIVMWFDINSDTDISGSYYYQSSGPDAKLSLTGIRYGDNLQLVETNDKGEVTGTFDGYINYPGRSYHGTFTNYKGTEFEFNLSGILSNP